MNTSSEQETKQVTTEEWPMLNVESVSNGPLDSTIVVEGVLVRLWRWLFQVKPATHRCEKCQILERLLAEEREERRRITGEALERVQVVRRRPLPAPTADGDQISLRKPDWKQARKILEREHSNQNPEVQRYWQRKMKESEEKGQIPQPVNGQSVTSEEIEADVKELEVD